MNAVRIKHEGVEGTALVSERAYLRVHQAKGWELADEQPQSPDGGQPELKRPQRNDSTDSWRQYAERRGMPAELADQMSRDGDDGLIAYFDNLDQTLES